MIEANRWQAAVGPEVRQELSGVSAAQIVERNLASNRAVIIASWITLGRLIGRCAALSNPKPPSKDRLSPLQHSGDNDNITSDRPRRTIHSFTVNNAPQWSVTSNISSGTYTRGKVKGYSQSSWCAFVLQFLRVVLYTIITIRLYLYQYSVEKTSWVSQEKLTYYFFILK